MPLLKYNNPNLWQIVRIIDGMISIPNHAVINGNSALQVLDASIADRAFLWN